MAYPLKVAGAKKLWYAFPLESIFYLEYKGYLTFLGMPFISTHDAYTSALGWTRFWWIKSLHPN